MTENLMSSLRDLKSIWASYPALAYGATLTASRRDASGNSSLQLSSPERAADSSPPWSEA